MRKWTLGVAGLLAAIVMMGCSVTTVPQKKETEQQERETLVIWSYFETQAQRQALDNLMRNFNQSQSLYDASWKYVPMTDFERSLSSAYTENNLPDMAILDNPDMPMLIQMSMFEDITEQVEKWHVPEEFYPSIVETTYLDGHYYGVPLDCNNTALIYNKDIFEKAGLTPPQTWEELYETAGKLTSSNLEGFLMCGIDGEQGAFQMLSWLLCAGEKPQEPGGEATKEALDFLYKMLRAGYLSENCINLTQTDVAREFANGKVAMMQNGPWALPLLDAENIPYGIVPFPGKMAGSAVVGGENIGILKGKNKEGSLAFMEYCVESGAIIDFCIESSVLPGKISAAEQIVRKNAEMKVFAEQMPIAITRTTIPNWSAVANDLTKGLYSLIAGNETAEDIASRIQVDIQEK